ncbi:MAG: amidophosphoribosyltransferase [Flavobacteriaceae bacterium]|nr:amidophosphoribosyltransferase [Flavobacteriaceae bacterium]
MENLKNHQQNYLEQFKNRPYTRNQNKEEQRDSLTEECGVFGLFSDKEVDTFSLSQFGLFALQHRGQEACGIAVLSDGKIRYSKEEGLVLDMFKNIKNPEEFMGNAVIGHTQYSAAKENKSYNFQPFFAKNEYDQIFLSMAYNGDLTNAEELKAELEKENVIFKTDSDAEVLLRMIQKHYHLGLEEAVKITMEKVKGAYSVVGIACDTFFSFRDCNGVRPLVLGVLDKDIYITASETCALDAVGAEFVRDVLPGEAIFVRKGEGLKSIQIKENCENKICSFEYVYYARPDSTIEGLSVYQVREKSGEKLWEQSPVEADVVIGVPDSGVPSAVGYSKASGIPFRPILIKNRYVGRSFIVPTQEMRERIVNLKLNPIVPELKGKDVVVIDDSIVRGTTSKILVRILKASGVKKIHFRSASPPVVSQCSGYSLRKKDLIAANKSVEEIREYLGVDSLDFLSVENMAEILNGRYSCSCVTGEDPSL